MGGERWGVRLGHGDRCGIEKGGVGVWMGVRLGGCRLLFSSLGRHCLVVRGWQAVGCEERIAFSLIGRVGRKQTTTFCRNQVLEMVGFRGFLVRSCWLADRWLGRKRGGCWCRSVVVRILAVFALFVFERNFLFVCPLLLRILAPWEVVVGRTVRSGFCGGDAWFLRVSLGFLVSYMLWNMRWVATHFSSCSMSLRSRFAYSVKQSSKNHPRASQYSVISRT